MENLEKRFLGTCELRSIDGEESPKIRGYAAIFDKRADLGYFTESVAKGAFTRTLQEGADVRALVDHEPSKILGRNKAGTLEVREDATGLYIEIDPPNTQLGKDVVESIKRGDLSQMSFGFRVKKQEWEEVEDEKSHRTLTDVDLFDVSVVTYPAYEDTEVSVRSLYTSRKEELNQVKEEVRLKNSNSRSRKLRLLELSK